MDVAAFLLRNLNGFDLAPPLDRDDVVHCPVLGGHLARGDDRCIAEVRELDGRHHAKFAGVRDYEALGVWRIEIRFTCASSISGA